MNSALVRSICYIVCLLQFGLRITNSLFFLGEIILAHPAVIAYL